jgi:hypothetical protein
LPDALVTLTTETIQAGIDALASAFVGNMPINELHQCIGGRGVAHWGGSSWSVWGLINKGMDCSDMIEKWSQMVSCGKHGCAR